MEIPLNGTGQKAVLLQKTYYRKCLILTLIILSCFSYGIYCVRTESPDSSKRDDRMQYPGIIGAICYLWYLIDCCRSASSVRLSNEMKSKQFSSYIQGLRDSGPRLGIGMECFHIKVTTSTRTTTWSDGSKTSSTSTSRQRVVTWSGEADFSYRAWDDMTGELTGIDRKKFTKLYLEKSYLFETTEGAKKFEDFKRDFINRNKDRDLSYDVYPIFQIAGYKDRVLLKAVGLRTPGYVHHCWYWIFSLILLSWPYRICLEFFAEQRRATVRKVIYI